MISITSMGKQIELLPTPNKTFYLVTSRWYSQEDTFQRQRDPLLKGN